MSTYRTCILQNNRNSTSCEALANMCVLNLYKSDPTEFNACQAHFEANQPLLKHSETLSDYRSSYLENGIANNFIKMTPFDTNNFYVAEYDLYGKLLRFKESDLARFEQCGQLQLKQRTCTVSVGTLLKYVGFNDAVFYELYIKVCKVF